MFLPGPFLSLLLFVLFFACVDGLFSRKESPAKYAMTVNGCFLVSVRDYNRVKAIWGEEKKYLFKRHCPKKGYKRFIDPAVPAPFTFNPISDNSPLNSLTCTRKTIIPFVKRSTLYVGLTKVESTPIIHNIEKKGTETVDARTQEYRYAPTYRLTASKNKVFDREFIYDKEKKMLFLKPEADENKEDKKGKRKEGEEKPEPKMMVLLPTALNPLKKGDYVTFQAYDPATITATKKFFGFVKLGKKKDEEDELLDSRSSLDEDMSYVKYDGKELEQLKKQHGKTWDNFSKNKEKGITFNEILASQKANDVLLSEKQIKVLHQQFEEADADHNGYINREEFIQAMLDP